MNDTGSLPEGLRLSAMRFPDRVALVAGEARATFGKLWTCSMAFAADLQENGVVPGDRVALALDGSWQYVAAYYGALLAGAIAVPLNVAAREPELAACIAHAEANTVVVDQSVLSAQVLRGLLPAATRVLEAGNHELAFDRVCLQPGRGQFAEGLARESPACIHYTSGTTGTPKGVLLSHGNLASNAAAIISYLALGPADSIVSVLPFHYAYGSSVLHTHLLCGGKVVVEKGFSFPHVVVQRLVAERATGFAGVPSTFALLLTRVRLEDFDLGALRYVTQAGAALPPELGRRLVEALPGTRFFAMYGQTEATSRISYLPPESLAEKPGSVGIGIPGVQIEVRDESRGPLNSGEVGHVWVRGPNVMLGYWRNPSETARVLVDGWLDTGDMGFLDADGYLYLAGRRSDIIKVGAHRVHPQDVEAVIAEMAPVVEVAVAGIGDAVLGEVVKAFVVCKDDQLVTEQDVRRHCLQRLAPYKVPKQVAIVSSLPRTASGKLRRNALARGEHN